MFLKFEKNTFHVYIVCSHCLIFFPANFYRVLCTFQDIQQHIDVSSFLVWKQLYKASIFFFKGIEIDSKHNLPSPIRISGVK